MLMFFKPLAESIHHFKSIQPRVQLALLNGQEGRLTAMLGSGTFYPKDIRCDCDARLLF